MGCELTPLFGDIPMLETNPYITADQLNQHPDIDAVRVDPHSLVVAYAPDERHVDSVPKSVVETIDEVVDETDWMREYDRGAAERHDWSSGRTHDPVTKSREQPSGYELQVRLTHRT